MTPRLVVELTNRCNLSCSHCFTGRHGGSDHLPLELLRRLLPEARAAGFSEVSYTGGDPTVYRWFGDAIRLAAETGFRWGMVTNGWSFPRVHEAIVPYLDSLDFITFSLDGARADTHDDLRGRGSFRRVMQAFSVCAAVGIPFTVNMVVTVHNRDEIGELATLCARLGASAVKLNHLMPNPITTAQGADLSPADRKAIEAEIIRIDESSTIPVVMSPGFYTDDLFPCAPLNGKEVNVDVHGNLTKCCALSGHGPGAGTADVVGDLQVTSFTAAFEQLLSHNEEFRSKKQAHFAADPVDTDYFPCWYCSVAFEKVDWLAEVAGHAWGELVSTSSPTGGWQPITMRARR